MDNNSTPIQVPSNPSPYAPISYVTCNWDSIVIATIVFIMMLFSMFTIKLYVYGDIYKYYNACYVPSYFFGDTEQLRIYGKTLETFDLMNSEAVEPLGDKKDLDIYNFVNKISKSMLQFFTKIRETFFHLGKEVYVKGAVPIPTH